MRKLQQAGKMLSEGSDIAAVCRELQVSEATYHRWRNQFGGLKADDARRLKELEAAPKRGLIVTMHGRGTYVVPEDQRPR